MKKLLFIIFALSSLAEVNAEKLILFEGRDSGGLWWDDYYFDANSIRKLPNGFRYRIVSDRSAGRSGSDGERSNVLFYELNCNEESVRLLQSISYAGQKGVGPQVAITERPQPWIYIDKTHLQYNIFKVLCNK